MVINVEGAIYHEGKWLMAERSEKEKHASGTLSFVGGTLEEERDVQDILEETLRREIREEVGVEVADEMHYVESKSFVADDGEVVVDVVFLCHYQSGEARIVSDEVAAIGWFTYEEIMQHPKTPAWIKQSMEKAVKMVEK